MFNRQVILIIAGTPDCSDGLHSRFPHMRAIDKVNHHALSPTATFAAGFAVRPFGALFFGRLGDIGAALRELVGGRQSAKAVERHFSHIATMSGDSILFAGALLIRR